jgi:hypothetical protein
VQWFSRSKSQTQAFDGPNEAKEVEDWGIIGLRNDGNGVPASILVEGAVKCAICQGFTEDQLVCEECAAVVTYLRAADNLAAFVKLMEFAARPGMLAILDLLIEDEMVTELLMQRMKNARNRV